MLRVVAILFALALVAGAHLAVAQDEPGTLRKDIEELREEQRRLRQDIEQLKGILRQRDASSRIRPVDVVLDIRQARSKGDRNARLVLVEFGDYECPFCAQHFHKTRPQIDRDYVQTGKLRYVFRDFPLQTIHKDAFRAAEGAACAEERGKFWEMHDALFANSRSLGVGDLKRHAEGVGLDASEFAQCLATGKHASKIQQSLADGQRAGVRATPSFLLGVTTPDTQSVKATTMLQGAQPYGVFREAIEGLLSSNVPHEGSQR